MVGQEKTSKGKVDQFDVEAVNAAWNRQPLYTKREKIHPKRASGNYRFLKWWIMAITLGIYYLTPFLRWNRGEFAPDQAVLLDMANRRFYFFSIEIWPHEFFYVAGLLVMAGIGLFLLTSTVGRAWCGYTCPQTVWVDLFLVVERFFEGDRNARIKLDKAPNSFNKMARKTIKHIVWIIISILTGGAWIFYFADAPTLAVDIFSGQAQSIAYMTVLVLAGTTYIFGGLMREQVCTYMCPWPRIQAAMLDEHSLTVTYNDWRGENRNRHAKKLRASGEVIGDCIDCNACVAVCPMGIDIREGQQLECITCALCIDACDSVMDKIGLEKGLISYATLGDYHNNMALALASNAPSTKLNSKPVIEINPRNVRDEAGRLFDKFVHTSLKSFIRPRTLIYSFIYMLIGLLMLGMLLTRDRLDLNVLKDRNPQFVMLSDGSVRNGYEIKILNMVAKPRRFKVYVEGLDNAAIKIAGATSDKLSRELKIEVEPDKLRSVKVFLTMDSKSIQSASMPFNFVVEEINGNERANNFTSFTSNPK